MAGYFAEISYLDSSIFLKRKQVSRWNVLIIIERNQ
jgi:hypothetical protein